MSGEDAPVDPVDPVPPAPGPGSPDRPRGPAKDPFSRSHKTQLWEAKADAEAGLLLGRLALRSRVIQPRHLLDAISLQERLRAIGGVAPPVGKVLVDLGLLEEGQVRSLLESQGAGARPEDDRIGGLAILNGLSTRGRIERAAQTQTERNVRGEPVQRLGEILVASGDLAPQAVRALLACQARLRGAPTPALPDSRPWEVVAGGYKVGDEMLLLEDTTPTPVIFETRDPWWLVAVLALATAILGTVLALVLAR
ncbi:MAG: hypothetical protein L0216_13165 [Planctomycetales bacterium]|nr:hypothetical protein [Planctomycetales bacterium]